MRVRREFEALRTVRSMYPNPATSPLPHMFRMLEIDAKPVLVSEFLRGRPLPAFFTSRASRNLRIARHVCGPAIRWLGEFHRLGLRLHSKLSADSLLEGNSWQPTISHGDFLLRNVILSTGKEVKVVDWENLSLTRSPAVDLVGFLLDVAGWILRSERKLVSHCFTPAGKLHGLVLELLRSYGEVTKEALDTGIQEFFAYARSRLFEIRDERLGAFLNLLERDYRENRRAIEV